MIKESFSYMATTGSPEPNDNKQPNISAAKVKELRDLTGAPMMDCKKALTEANGDAEKAVVILRKRGAAVWQNYTTRITSERT
jgi:translation elongation factor EF-Ts